MVTNPKRIPVGVSVVDVANAQGLRKRVSPEELQARMRESLSVQNPLDNTDKLAVDIESQMTLHITDIDPYDRNPRKARNERIGDIKASIRQVRTLSPLTVTKRPGATRYMVESGGNTRLQVLKELWEETHDPKFEYLVVTARPWVSESHVLTAHLVENETRGDMVFWDKARAVSELKGLIEAEQNSKLSLRNLEVEAKSRGLVVSRSVLSLYAFAVDQLADLGESAVALGTRDVVALQPAFNHLQHYAAQYGCDGRWPELRANVLRSQARTWVETGELDAKAIIDRFDQAIAMATEHSVEQVRTVREMAQKFGSDDIAGLVAMYSSGQGQSQRASAASSAPMGSDEEPDEPTTLTTTNPSPTTSPETPEKESTRGHGAVAVTDRIKDRLTELAHLCSVGDCLRLHDDMPVLFYMEIPDNESPIDLNPDTPDRYYAWWALAALSGQISGTFADRMPEDSAWRCAQMSEDVDDDHRLMYLIETVLGNPLSVSELAQWLTSPANSGADTYWRLVAAIRDLRQAEPDRFVHDHESAGGAQC